MKAKLQKYLSEVIWNISSRTEEDYEMTSDTQWIYDKWQIDAYINIRNLIDHL